MSARWLAAAILLSSVVATAEPVVLRMATEAPDGTAWAREIHNFGRDLEQASSGNIKVKLYFGGLAGDEAQVDDRIRRGQLDGALSGHMQCERHAPSMRVLRLPGMFQSRGEATDVMNRMQATLEQESARAGMLLVATTGLGPDVIFTRTAVHSMAELRKLKLWRWDADQVGIATSRAMGMQIVPMALSEGAPAYDSGRVDGYLAVPAAALAFQWSAQAKFVTDLRGSYLYACVIFSQRSFQSLPVEGQQAVRAASAQLGVRMEELGRQTDEQLLGGLFQRQGLKVVPVSERFRAEYFASARSAREAVIDKLVPRELVDRALRMLADYRAEHAAR